MPSETFKNISGSSYSKQKWLDNHHAIKSRMRADLLVRLQIEPGDRVLDLGCGMGHWSFLVASSVGVKGKIIGVDADPESIEIAKGRRKAHVLGSNIYFNCSTIESFEPEPNHYDIILMFNILSYVVNPLHCIERYLRALKRNGRLIIKDTDIQSDFFHPVPRYLYESVMKAALGGPAPASVGNFDPFFASKIPKILNKLPYLQYSMHTHSFSVLGPASPEEHLFIATNAAMLSQMAAQNGSSDVAERWLDLFRQAENRSITTTPEFLYAMNEFVFQVRTLIRDV